MPIVGTAGHVDHGKSTLVETLTGRDPDRWAEEKTRGLTIDLGFAWTTLGDGIDVGFVDVPGHERFIKNMLAGVGALDVALFVVAGDEGWMPQSEEHLAVLDLLEVRHGVIAVTRVDLVDDDMLELATLDVVEHVAGTTLDGWPIVPVSAVAGTGIDELRAALAEALRTAGAPQDHHRPRMWVDRSFTISGAGVVVTGTLTGGALSRDTELDVWPGPSRVRIRGLQSHEAAITEALPGSRTAVNLSGVETAEVPRGALLAGPNHLAATDRLLIDLRTVRTLDSPLTDRGAYHLHAGTGAWPVQLRIVGGDAIETRGAALVGLPEQLAFESGDRVILREVGRQSVVAGGRVLDPAPTGRLADIANTVSRLREVVSAAPDDRAAALLHVRGVAAMDTLRAHSGGGTPPGALVAGTTIASSEFVARAEAAATAHVSDYHAANPLRPGIPKAQLSSKLGIDRDLLGAIVDGTATLDDAGPVVRASDFEGGWGERQENEWAAARADLLADGLAVRRASQLNLEPETFHALLRDGRLIRIDEDLVYLPEQIEEITARLGDLDDGFTVAAFRDALELSRRHAVPLLEWLDGQGWTSRRGDVRAVRRRPGPAPSDAPTR